MLHVHFLSVITTDKQSKPSKFGYLTATEPPNFTKLHLGGTQVMYIQIPI